MIAVQIITTYFSSCAVVAESLNAALRDVTLMASWDFYVTRNIVDNGKFDPSQIEAALQLGLFPQIALALETPAEVVSSLVKYLHHRHLSGLLLPCHGVGMFSSPKELSLVHNSLDTIVELNKKAGCPVVRELIFHPGRLVQEVSGIGINAGFSAAQYLKKIDYVKAQVRRVSEYAEENGITLLLENIPPIDFAAIKVIAEKPIELIKDSRWGNTLWLPEPAQRGNLGSAIDLAYLTDGKVCVDVEHLIQAEEYSRQFDCSRYGEFPQTDAEREVKSRFGVLVREGQPVWYNSVVNPAEIIGKFNGRIPLCHLGGQVRMIYEDNGVKKIGSHMPITFGEQDNEFIEDKTLMKEMNVQCEENLKKYLGGLHEAGCRRAVLELHIGNDYTGEKWRHYHKQSLENVENIIKSFS